MVNASEELKSKYVDDLSHRIYYYIEFYHVIDMDNHEPFLTLTNTDLVENSIKYTEGISGGDTLELGSVYSASLTFDAADIPTTLKGKYIKAYQKVDTLDEVMSIGRFTITSVEKTSDRRIKTVTAYDYTCFFDENGADILTKIKDCKTCKEALRIISTHYSLEWGNLDFAGANYALKWDYEQVKNDNVTVRDIVAMFGEILGGWIKVNREGKLYLKRITKPTVADMEILQYFRENPQFDENETGTILDVVYTDDSGTTYSATGTEGANIDLSGNFFLIGGTESTIKPFLTLAYEGAKTIQYYPAECTIDARPYVESGDFVSFTDNGATYYTLIKERTLQGIQVQVDTYTCGDTGASSEASYIGSSNRQSPVVEAVRRANYRIELARQELAEMLANSSGMYDTRVKQEDGSEILYLHDKSKLEESTNIIKVTSEAIGFSTDGGTTYPFGLLINGDVIARILSAEGINANWITAGDLILGGSEVNTDGSIKVYDADNKLICQIDRKGFKAILGDIAGWKLTDTEIKSTDGTVRLNSASDSLKFYNAGGTLLMQINGNGVYNYDTSGTLRNAMGSSYNTYYDTLGVKRITINADGFNQYSTDGTYLGHLGRSTVYAVDSSGAVTDEEIGEILSVNVEDAPEALGWAVFAMVPGSDIDAKQRRVYYCSKDNGGYQADHFYVGCETQMLRHTETDPYYAKKLKWTDTGFTLTVGTAGTTTRDITNDFEVAEDGNGNVTAITNKTTGRQLVIE